MEYLVEKSQSYEQTRDAKGLLSKRVLSKSGSIVGKVREVRLDSQHRELRGVLVSRGLFRPSVYISAEYISRLTPQAVILSIEPAMLFRRRAVISSDGKKFGRVKEVLRERETNNITGFLVRRNVFWTYEVPGSEVRKANKAIMLKKSYEQAKSSFKKVTR